MIVVLLERNLARHRATFSRVPCVGERIRVSDREGTLVVWRVVHLEACDAAAEVYLTSETSFAQMKIAARGQRKPAL